MKSTSTKAELNKRLRRWRKDRGPARKALYGLARAAAASRASRRGGYTAIDDAPKGTVSVNTVSNTQIINRGSDNKKYIAKKSYIQNQIFGTGAAVSAVLQWSIAQFPDIGNYSLVFNQYRCYKLKYHFRLQNQEMTDNAIIPFIYIRYNDDPDLTTPSESTLLNMRNVMKHTFTPGDLTCTYVVYPKKMMASQIYGSTGFTASPRKATWEDVDKSVGHYGLQYYIPNLPSGMTIEVTLEATVGFREQW